MIHIASIAKSLCMNVALFPADKSVQKNRVMHLWEKQCITSGDVERLFEKHELRGA